MNISVAYLIDRLAEFEPVPSFELTAGGLRVTDVAVYRPELGALRDNTLYLCLRSLPDPKTAVPGGACFVVGPRTRADHLPLRVTLGRPGEEENLYHVLLDGAERYRLWLDELVELSLKRVDFQTYCDAGERMLVDPVMLLDASFRLIAISRSATAADYPFFDFEGTQSPMPEYLFRMPKDMKTIRQYVPDKESQCSVVEMDGGLQVLYNLLVDGAVAARVVFPITRAPLTQGLLDLLFDFCRYLRYLLEGTEPQTRQTGMAEFALEQILKFGSTKAMRELLDPRENWAFVTAVLQLVEGRGNVSSYLKQIQDILPHAAVCYHEDRVTAILCVGDRDTDPVFKQFQFQRLEVLAETLGGRFGLSYPFTHLAAVSSAIQQSVRALELPASLAADPAGRLRAYEDVSLLDITDRFFTDDRFEHFLPPEIANLYLDDVKTGKRNCALLYYYLVTGRSLAAAGEILHMHRSTVVYKLERIRNTFGIQMDKPERTQLYMVCALACMLRHRRSNGGEEELLDPGSGPHTP